MRRVMNPSYGTLGRGSREIRPGDRRRNEHTLSVRLRKRHRPAATTAFDAAWTVRVSHAREVEREGLELVVGNRRFSKLRKDKGVRSPRIPWGPRIWHQICHEGWLRSLNCGR